MKFLGSYPAAGEAGPARRGAVDAADREASTWLEDLRAQIRP